MRPKCSSLSIRLKAMFDVSQTLQKHLQCKAWWCQHYAVLCFSAANTGRLPRLKWMQIIQRNLRGKAPQWQVSCRLHQNTRDYEAEHKAKDTQVNIQEWPSPDLNSVENLWLDLKNTVHSNLTETRAVLQRKFCCFSLFYINGNCISLHFVLFRQNKISSWSPGWKIFFFAIYGHFRNV